MSTGLVLGKFAPLHKGHQMLIEKSMAQNDHTVVLIYDCRLTTKIPLTVRARWIERLYPKAIVRKCWGAPTEVSREPEHMKLQEKFILDSLNGLKIDVFYSSEWYGDHVSKALKAKNEMVDQNRQTVPISSTMIRQILTNDNTLSVKPFVSDVVYHDLITRILLLGAPSTGKTTLCRALASHFGTKWVPEYGREYWARNNKGRRLTTDQLDTIAATHAKKVLNATQKANRYLFVDTDASVTKRFCEYYHNGRSTANLDGLTEESRYLYDYVVVCGNEIPYDDTEDRSGETQRTNFQGQILDDLAVRRIPFGYVFGNVNDRLYNVNDLLYNLPYKI